MIGPKHLVLLLSVAISNLAVVPSVLAMTLSECFDACRVQYHCMSLSTRAEQSACIPQQEACRQACAANAH